jgi:hypothetical protein
LPENGRGRKPVPPGPVGRTCKPMLEVKQRAQATASVQLLRQLLDVELVQLLDVELVENGASS